MSRINMNPNLNKIKQDYILLICHCEKNKENAEIQKKTWLKNLPKNIIYFHIIGNNNVKQPFQFYHKEKLLVVKTNDDYNSLPHKMISAFEAIHQTYNYKYIFKTDDTQICIKSNFFQGLIFQLNNLYIKAKTILDKSNYGGFIIEIKQETTSFHNQIHSELDNNILLQPTRYCSGSFYYLSKDSITYLLTKKNNIEKQKLEDYSNGIHLPFEYKENMLHIPIHDIFYRFKNDELIHSLHKQSIGKINQYFIDYK